MESGKTTIERAFELAQSGSLESITDLLRKLKAEGYRTDHITGPSLRSQLRGLIAQSHQHKAEPAHGRPGKPTEPA